MRIYMSLTVKNYALAAYV